SAHGKLIGAADERETAFGRAVLAVVGNKRDLKALAELGGALGQLDAAQLSKLLDQLERVHSYVSDDRLPWLFTWWIKHDPAAANAWIQPRLELIAASGAPDLEQSMPG